MNPKQVMQMHGWMSSVVTVLAVAGATYAGPMTPLKQNRMVSAVAMAPPCGGKEDSENLSAPGFDSFSAGIDALGMCDTAYSIACSSQFSGIDSSLMSAWGNTTSSAWSNVQTVIQALSTTHYEVIFEISQPTEFQLTGQLSVSGVAPVASAGAKVRLTSADDSVILEPSVVPGRGGVLHEIELHSIGLLAPGSYTLRAEADATIDSTVPPSGGGFAQFSIFFHAVKPGDVTDNGVVNVDDLLGVINAWGVCQGKSPCPADIAPLGGNGIVNVDDLLKVINNWG